METKLDQVLNAYASTAQEALSDIAAVIAVEVGIAREAAYQALLMRLRDGASLDGRAALWRVRVRLYQASDGYETPVADSDPELDATMPGATVIATLPGVAGFMAELATSFHNASCAGLDRSSLKRAIAGLRTQMSHRRDGTGVMRITYRVIQDDTERQMVARADIVRCASGLSS